MKKIIALLLAVMLLCTFTTAFAEYDASGDPAVTLIWSGNCVAADIHAKAMHEFAAKVNELSGGSVTCEVYTDSTYVGSEGELQAILDNDIQICYLSFATLSTIIPSYAMFASGYFWSSYDHMHNTLNSDFAAEKIWPAAEEGMGLKFLGAAYLGSRVVNTRTKPIEKYDDMNGVMLRMPNSEAWMDLGKALGAEPTALAFSELYTALQTGSVDGQDNPLASDKAAGFFEVAPYFAITNHVVDSVMPAFNAEAWNSMTDAQRAACSEAMVYAIAYNDEMRIKEEEEVIAFFQENGCTITYPDVEEFKTKATAYYADNNLQGDWDMDLYAEIQGMA